MLFNSQAIARGWQNTRTFASKAWHHTTKLAGQFDTGMKIGRRLLSAMSPLLDQLSVDYTPAIQAIGAYDHGKAEVMHGVNNVMTHYQRVKRQVPELQL